MQKILNAVSVLALCIAWLITLLALYGSHPLPPRIAIHFDGAGHANGWGSPAMLWIMPIVVTGVFALITWAARHPQSFNFPVRVTPTNRGRLQAVALAMVSWIKAEVVCLFAGLQWATIESARRGSSVISPWSIAVGILAIWFTIGWYFVAMRRTARG